MPRYVIGHRVSTPLLSSVPRPRVPRLRMRAHDIVLQPQPLSSRCVRPGSSYFDTHRGRSLQVGELAKHFDWTGPIGCGFPAAVVGGVVKTAANIDNSWIGENAEELISKVRHPPLAHPHTQPNRSHHHTNRLDLQRPSAAGDGRNQS